MKAKDIFGKIVSGTTGFAGNIFADASASAKKTRRTDDELSKVTKGLEKRPEDYSVRRGVSLRQAASSAPSHEGVYVIYLDGMVMKCGRAAYGQGLRWRFTQYYNLNYDDRARKKDYWSVSSQNRDRVTVSWQACPVSKCKELEAKLFRKYGKGPWGLRAPSGCSDDTLKLLI